MYSQETKDRFIELRAQGKSFVAIAEEIGVAKPTLITWSHHCEQEIGNLRQIQLEALREKCRLSKEHELESLGRQLGAVEGELEKRDLSAVPTGRLFDMWLKLVQATREVNGPLTLSRFPESVDDLHSLARPSFDWKA